MATQTLEANWEVDDTLWAILEPILLKSWPRKRTGRRPACWRVCLNGIIFQMRTGCQWNKLPKEFGDDSTVHRWFQRWAEEGVLERIWAVLVEHCDDLRGVEWKWQAAGGLLAKARFGGADVGPNPTDRAKNGTKTNLVVEGQGGPLGVSTAPANWHDARCLEDALLSIVVQRPGNQEEHLLLDKGFDNPTGRDAAVSLGYVAHIRTVRKEARPCRPGRRKPRRRVAFWTCHCRALLSLTTSGTRLRHGLRG